MPKCRRDNSTLNSILLVVVRSAQSQESLQGTLPDHIEAEFNEELWNGEHAPRLQAASLVVGLHPDQVRVSPSFLSARMLLCSSEGTSLYSCNLHSCYLALSGWNKHVLISILPCLHHRLERACSRSAACEFEAAVQATDSIVEFAVQYDKAFAVVPCCVFPRLFKHRRLKDSVPVVVHAELVEYLRQLGGQSCQVDHLTFEGMNQAVFRKQAL